MKNKIPSLLKKIIIVLGGAMLAFCLVETGLCLLKGIPPPLDNVEIMKRNYCDIYKPFFRLDTNSKCHVSQRPMSLPSSVSVRKTADEKRIFVLGESVANYYPSRMLRNGLVFPNCDTTVVNCGMGGYDSYRISLIAAEVMRLEPDLVILMMGNNEGNVDPVTVNHWLYEYPLLSKFWTTRLITDRLNPPFRASDVNGYFEENLERIIVEAKRNNVLLAVCTLPANRRIPRWPIDYEAMEQFDAWWLLYRDPLNSMKRFERLHRDDKDRKYTWYIGEAAERSGLQGRAREYFMSNVDTRQEDRNIRIRKVCSRNKGSVILLDVDAMAREWSGGAPGFEVMWDGCHLLNSFYAVVTKRIAQELRLRGITVLSGGMQAAARPKKPGAAIKDRPANDDLLQPNDCNVSIFAGFFNQRDVYVHLGALMELLRYGCRKEPGFIERFRNSRARVLTFANIEEYNLRLCLLGEFMREERKYNEAITCFNEVLQTEPENYHALLFRGLCHFDKKEYDLAEQDFRALKNLKQTFDWLSVQHLRRLSVNHDNI